MATKNSINRLMIGILGIIFLSGCFDMGDYQDINDYYSCYPNVDLYTNYECKTYSMDNFYSNSTVNDLACNIDELPYQAVSIYVAKRVRITDFYIFIASLNPEDINIELYLAFEPLKVSKNEDTDKYEFANMDKLSMQTSTIYHSTNEFSSVNLDFKAENYLENVYLILLFPDNISDSNINFRFTNILLRGLY